MQNPCGKNTKPTSNTSCIGITLVPGATDINFSGDPYMGDATIHIAAPCADIHAHAGVAIFAEPKHGARNKPEVLAAMHKAVATLCQRHRYRRQRRGGQGLSRLTITSTASASFGCSGQHAPAASGDR